MVLGCDISARTLSVAKVVSIPGEKFIPTGLGCSSSAAELLWMVTGVSNLPGPSLACVRVISGFKKRNPDSSEPELIVLEDNEAPRGEKVLEKLQGTVSVEAKVFSAAAEALKTAMCNLLLKKQYPSERREFRKRTRNDRKIKQ